MVLRALITYDFLIDACILTSHCTSSLGPTTFKVNIYEPKPLRHLRHLPYYHSPQSPNIFQRYFRFRISREQYITSDVPYAFQPQISISVCALSIFLNPFALLKNNTTSFSK